jgi:CHAT domain-containing protein/tetratricopeptide (TPR) repeat protein
VCRDAAGQEPRPESVQIRVLLDRGEAAAAERAAAAWFATVDVRDGSTSIEEIEALNLLVESKIDNGKAAESSTREQAERVSRLTEQREGRYAPELAVPLRNLAAVFIELGDLRTALATYQRALAIRERQSPRIHTELATSLEDVALVEILLLRLGPAQETLQRALLLRETRVDAEAPLALARPLELQALLYRYTGQYAAAFALLERIQTIRGHHLPDRPQTPALLQLRGDLLFLTRDIPGAGQAWSDGLTLAGQTLDAQHPARSRLLRKLALAADAIGDRARNRDLLAQAVEIGKHGLAPCNPAVGGLLNDMAQSKARDGVFATAKELYRQELATLEKCHANADWIATALHNSAKLAYEMGDVFEAERLHERAIRMWSDGLGRNHAYVALGLDALAEVLASRKEFTRARALYRRALAIRRRGGDKAGPDVAWTLTNLARTVADQGDVVLALRYVREAIATYGRAGAFDEPDHLARALELQGVLQSRRGDLEAAHASLVAAIAERTRIFGAAHPLVADSRSALARVELAQGTIEEALRDALEAERSGREHLQFLVRYLPERQAMAYATKRPRGLDLALSIADRGASAAPVLDAMIRSRGVILDELALRARTPVNSDAESTTLRSGATEARKRYANLLVRSLQETLPPGVLDEARRQKEDAETALAEHSLAARAELTSAQVGLDLVRQALPPGAMLVSFAKYDRQVDGQSRQDATYGAFVLRAGSSDVLFVSLGAASKVDTLIRDWWNEASGRAFMVGVSMGVAQRRYLAAATRLRHDVWDPLAPHLAGATRIFVVPDGLLSLVNFDTLPDEGGRYLVEGTAVLHYLSTERDLIPPAGPASPQGLLAVGGASFGQAPGGIRSGARGAGCTDLGRIRFENLPGSGREVDEIGRLWTALRPHDAIVLSGAAATETAVKHALAGQRVVHLATHGFFLGSCESTPLPLRGSRGVGGLAPASGRRPASTPTHNPLRLAGLAFAGANRHHARSGSGDDGILTAEEIAGLDLQGTEWAVLSACDTGLGDITSGEGVIGLRRAFQIAGARTVIMSLWAVDDRSTTRWMHALYSGRLTHNLDTATAVHEANLSILRDARAASQSTHPFFWALFVAVGDWR